MGSTGVTYETLNDVVGDEHKMALQHLSGVIERMNAHGVVDF